MMQLFLSRPLDYAAATLPFLPGSGNRDYLKLAHSLGYGETDGVAFNIERSPKRPRSPQPCSQPVAADGFIRLRS